ncbi:MAG: hypothetical protein U0232_01910 [Thermomicrobiales bacterium]
MSTARRHRAIPPSSSPSKPRAPTPCGLQRLLAEAELTNEDWGTIRQLCHECSTGRAGAHEGPAEFVPGAITDTSGIAAETEAAVQDALTHWSAAWPTSRVLEVQRALG